MSSRLISNSEHKGKLIVIEGTDGSGKKTQTDLLVKSLSEETGGAESMHPGTPRGAFKIDFPRYGTPSAYFVEKYLHGEYGTAEEVGPYLGSLFYTLDRFDHSKIIKEKLEEGTHVICDRFTSANMGHQAGKIDDLKKRDEYLSWLDQTEFEMCGIPRPDLTIFLFVSPEINQRLMAQRKDKGYLKGKKQDIHEADMNHLKKASEAFLYVAKKYGWVIIDCAPVSDTNPDGALLSIPEIQGMIRREISGRLGI